MRIELPLDFAQACDIVRDLKHRAPLGACVDIANYDQHVAQHATRKHLPLSEMTDSVWVNSIGVPKWDRWPTNKCEDLVFIPHLMRQEVTLAAIDSVLACDRPVVVFDQEDRDNWPEAVSIARSAPLTFTRVQNWFQKQASILGLKRFYFMHSDATVSLDTFERMDAMPGGHLVFTAYDALVRFDVEMLRDIGCWDESFEWYVSDIDFYNRIRWDGKWCVIDCPDSGVCHHGSMTKRNLSAEELRHVNHAHAWAKSHYMHKWGHDFEADTGVPHKVPYNA